MKNDKALLIIFLLLLIPLGFVGCVDDENLGVYKSKFADIMVRFELQNERGETTNVFKQGENIVFRVVYENNGDKRFPLTNKMLYPLFNVYTEEGTLIDKPWDSLMDSFEMKYVFPKSSYTVMCYWLTPPAGINSPFKKEYERMPLSKGNYYSAFDIQSDDYKIIICKVNFTVE